MRRLCFLALWLVGGLTGTILVVFPPDSWQCVNTAVDAVAWNPNTGKMLVEYAAGHHAEVWNPTGTQPDAQFVFAAHTAPVRSVAYSPDGKTALTGSEDGTAILWDVHSGVLLHNLQGHLGPVISVAIAPDGKTALTGGGESFGILWDVHSGALLHILRGHTDAVTSLAYAPDSKTVLTGSLDHTAIL